MSDLILRDYQQEFIDAVRLAMSSIHKTKFRHIAGYLPQGSGKSVCIAAMALSSMGKGNKVLVLTHRQEIEQQNFEKLDALGGSVSFIDSNHSELPEEKGCYCAMTQTLARRLKASESWQNWFKQITFIIVDEAHRAEHDAVLKMMNPETYVVGVSATLLRSGSNTAQLGRFYDTIVKGITPSRLIAMNFLAPSKNYVMQAPVLDKLEIDRATGDYNVKQLQHVFGRKERYCGVVKEYKRLAPGTKTIVFTTGVEHCIDMCKEFNLEGIRAKYLVSSKNPETDELFSGSREEIKSRFEAGEFDVICNVFTLDTGFDCPAIETVILDFSTQSYARYAQAVGRGSRVFPGKKFFSVLDFGDNVNRFGTYEDDNPPMSLWHCIGGNGVPPVKECPGCGRLVPVQLKECPVCGYVFPTKRTTYEAELTEFIKECDESLMGMKEWVARKVLDGWSNNRILMAVCKKNTGREHAAFNEAVPFLRDKNGEDLSPKYWWAFKKFILNKSSIK